MAPPEVKLFVDPVCPFAWTAYQWLVDVEASHRIYFDVRIMSLAILNDGSKGYPPEDQRGLDSAWRPVRVAAALELERDRADCAPTSRLLDRLSMKPEFALAMKRFGRLYARWTVCTRYLRQMTQTLTPK